MGSKGSDLIEPNNAKSDNTKEKIYQDTLGWLREIDLIPPIEKVHDIRDQYIDLVKVDLGWNN